MAVDPTASAISTAVKRAVRRGFAPEVAFACIDRWFRVGSFFYDHGGAAEPTRRGGKIAENDKGATMFSRQHVSRLLSLGVCLAMSAPVLAGFAATDSYLLSTGRGSGDLDSEWYTTVWVYNPNDTDATVRFSFLERNRSNTSPLVYDDTVAAKSVRKYNDAVVTMFGVKKFGAIRVVSDLKLVVVSRIYSQPEEGEAASVGQFLPALPTQFAIARGESTDLIGVRQHTPPESWDFRYNYGVVETAGADATVKISAYHQNAGFMKDKTISLRPYEAKQWNVSDLLGGGKAWNWRLTIEVTEGSGRVLAFGSGAANSSNDPSTFEMSFKESLLADSSGGLTLPYTGSATVDDGAVFEVTNDSASGTGVTVRGGRSGGWFQATDGSADTTLALSDTGGTGIWATGTQEGGYFGDSDGSGQAWIARGNRGVEATASEVGGAFWTTGDASIANCATANSGVEAFGPEQGGLFGDTDGTSWASLAWGASGVNGTGNDMGGWFAQTDLTSQVYLASGTAGINAYGDETGGYFENSTDQSAARLGHNGYGIEAFGAGVGGYFQNNTASGKTWTADGDRGLTANGNELGGYFEDLDDGTWGTVAQGGASFSGNGTKGFVQNHPYDATRVIVYAAHEGDEVGTYTRGTARLSQGEALVALGETFEWVTNPDLGLTVYLTPVGSWSQLYVAERSTTELVVRSAGGDPEAIFDYVVMGLRIGFEEASVVRERRIDAPIPSIASVQKRYRDEPELRRYTALERFEAMQREIGDPLPEDRAASRSLVEAVGRIDAESHTSSRHAWHSSTKPGR
jgi:hypothetical protein